MSYQIKFKDGSVFVSPDAETYPRPLDLSAVYENTVLAIRTSDYVTPSFTKEDYDGHIWTWNGTDLIVGNNLLYVVVPIGKCVIFNNIGGDNTQRGINAFDCNVYYNNTKQWRGHNGVANGVTIGSFISDNPDLYECYNFISTGVTQIEIHDTRPGERIIWGGYGGSSHSIQWWETNFPNSWSEYIPPEPDTDPYSKGGNSDTGGGTGTFSETGDTIGIPGLPTLSAVDTGFITLFNPTAAQVKQLANYMWSNSFDLATFKNIVANPMDCILGLTIVPVNPPDAGTKAVTVGNIPTDVSLPYLSSQYVEVDCGTLNVQEFWGSYLDYSPYTKMSLYLPYIGIVPLDIDDVMNASISIKYHVDVLSGACVAYVLCNGTQLYTYIGQCSSNVPVTSNDFTNTVNGILGIAGNVGSLMSGGGNIGGIVRDVAGMASNAINAAKPNIQKSGAMSGTGGLMGVQTPYLICQRPRQSVPGSQNTYTGYPANITRTLGELSGYTEVEKIHLDGIPCTDDELNEILELLESGVII